MKRFIETKFFLALQDASQTGADIDARVLGNSYTARGTVLCIARQHRKGRPPTRLLARQLKFNVIKLSAKRL
jgi:hypothetical protein